MQNQRQQPGNQTVPQEGFSNAQLFVVGFVGWLILQMFAPKEWNNVVGTFLSLEATVLLLSASLRTGTLPQQSTVQFLLAAYLGYFILYHGNQPDSTNGKSSASTKKSPTSKQRTQARKPHPKKC